jgi:1-acyl-sn-glycerol-3-phosphate acyltransferase
MVGKNYLNKFHPKSKFIRHQAGYLALLLGAIVAKITVRGKWHLPAKGGYIVASNHFSIIDPPFFKYAIQKPINFLAASDQEVSEAFLWALHLYGFIPIDRENIAPSTIKKAKKVLRKGEILGIFPEGSTTSPILRKPKNGAVFLSTVEKVPIVPMAIYGAETAWQDIFKGIRPKVYINIGKPFGPFEIRGTKKEKQIKMKRIGDEMAVRIASLLPTSRRGAYEKDSRISNFQVENKIKPMETMLSPYYDPVL